MGTAGWIVLIVVVVAVFIALALTVGRSQAQRRRVSRADGIREEAAERARDIERREAEADERETAAQRARAEAEQRIAQAQQLESDAQERRASLEQEREEIDERLARADQVDPRVGTHAERTAAARAHTETGGMGENGDADAETDASGRRLSTEDTEVVHETSTSSERG